MTAESLKARSDHLRGDIDAELRAGTTPLGGESATLLKFHGVYQQDDRDRRRRLKQAGEPLAHSCMVRASVPGGSITAAGWAALDALADIGDGTLRLTTRQGVQYHFVEHADLRNLVARINRTGLTTLGACGDVVRNVMACPHPDPERRAIIEPLVEQLVRRFRPRTRAYWELFIAGEKAVTAEEAEEPSLPLGVRAPDGRPDAEPILGDTYLPRKFKIGVAWPGDDCVDIHSHDVGLIPTLVDGTSGALTGWTVLAGGGMGMSHARPDDTRPVVGKPVCWVPPDAVLDVVQAIVETQRDVGNREDRAQARLKYVLDERGVPWLRGEIERRTGLVLPDPKPGPKWTDHEHLGWIDAAGAPTLAVPIPSGRISGAARGALRTLAFEGAVDGFRVTPRQDLLLLGVGDRARVEAVLQAAGLSLVEDHTPLRSLAIACPALPTCGQALGESERVLPSVIEEIERLLEEVGEAEAPIRINMTGCPNGCARPYTSELGIVGRSKRTYDLYIGGGTGRLALLLRDDVPLADIVTVLRPVAERFADRSDRRCRFGDWADAEGIDALRAVLPEPTRRRRRTLTAVPG